MPLQDALDCVAEAGFAAVEVWACPGGHVEPAQIRDDFETPHLLIGFGCARARLELGSLTVQMPSQNLDEGLKLVCSACTLAHALGLPEVGLAPAEDEVQEPPLAQWLPLAAERETQLVLAASFWTSVSQAMAVLAAQPQAGLSVPVSCLQGMAACDGASARQVRASVTSGVVPWEDVASRTGLAQAVCDTDLVVSVPPTGGRGDRVKRLRRCRDALGEAPIGR